MNDYYVYIYYRLDINEPFYVGMGHNNRWKDLKEYNRNKYFMRIANKHPIVCDIVIDNLTEEQAHGIECWIINELVFEHGYSIDIPNNRSAEKGYHLVNCTWGGEGTSGMNPYDMVDEEKREEWKRKIGEASKSLWEDKIYKSMMCESRKGENNGMYGRKHTEESKIKMSENKKGKYCGENSPLYGKQFSEEHKKKLRENHADVSRGNNPNARKVICLNTKEIFECIADAKEKYLCNDDICLVCSRKRKSCGELEDGTPLTWMYLEDYEKATEWEVNRRLKRAKRRKGKPVLCLTTKLFFYNLVEASDYYNCNINSIISCCKGDYKSAGKLPDGTKLVWRKIIWNHNKKYRIKGTN